MKTWQLISYFCSFAIVAGWRFFPRIVHNHGRKAITTSATILLQKTALFAFPTQQNAYLSEFPTNIDSRSLKSTSQKVETDIFGQLNFCLRQSDTVLSGPSRSKVLNEVTNEVFKAIMIGFPPIVDEVLQRIPFYRNLTTHTPCVLDPDEKSRSSSPSSPSSVSATPTIIAPKQENDTTSIPQPPPSVVIIDNCETDLALAHTYITWLEELLTRGHTKNSQLLGGIYDRGYKRLLTVLKDAHCRFPNDEVIEFRPIPIDHNICLSLLDVQFVTSATTSSFHSKENNSTNANNFLNLFKQIPVTKTQDLNQISNIVVRCILYGGRKDRNTIAEYIENVYCQQFAHRWTKENLKTQEIFYLKALAILLKENLAAAEAAIAFNLDRIASKKIIAKPTDDIWNRELSDISDEEFSLYFEDTIVDNNAPLKSSKYSSTATAGHTTGSETTSTSTVMESTPFAKTEVYDYSDVEQSISEQDDSDNRNLRLYDTYQNAFHRVVEVCLTEIGSSKANGDMPQTDEFVQSFLIWEQTLRRNLTVDLWNKNPEELTGTWELVNVGGRGSLNSIMVSSNEEIFASVDGVSVEFYKDGHLEVSHASNKGENWFFKPGPAHLDTCEFYISSKGTHDVTLKYLGFIDRGQRIESRFSKKPIKMTGRVMAIVKGEPKGSSRFVMVLKRK